MIWPVDTLLRRLTDNPLQRRNIFWLLSAGLLGSAGALFFQGPVLQTYLLEVGVTKAQIGLLGSVAGITGAGAMLALMGVADRIERRVRAEVLLGLVPVLTPIALVVLTLLSPLLQKASVVFGALLVLSLILPLVGSLAAMVHGSLYVRLIHVNVRGRLAGVSGLVCGLTSMGVGLVVGKVLAVLGVPLGYTVCFGLAPVFFVAVALARSQLSELPELQKPGRRGSPFPWAALLEVLKLKQFRALLAPNILRGLTSAFGFFAWIVAKERLDLPAEYAGLTVTVNALAGTILGAASIGLLLDRWGPGLLAFAGYMLTAVAVLGLGVMNSPMVFLALYGLIAFGGTLIGTAVPLGVFEIGPPELMGAFNGARMILLSMGGAIALPVVGHLLEAYAPLHVFAGGAVLLLVNGIWYWHGFRRRA